ncbi:MAG: asparagine synthase (glutamine-hydrolyzing) [Gemmatimonadota bacterium]|nr:asparagine synthase (glutamine-hydrolyzing) [Gemmatimonadota bacterium]
MCGLTGFFRPAGATREESERAIQRMIVPIRHRGPDDSGTWCDPSAGIALGFRRLAILDLSALGHQPMRSASGRYTMIFNGEIYNFLQIRAELERDGMRFRSHSDTEVILGAFERWGIDAAVPRLLGMFAIAVWDGERRSLSLIRDQLGIKPMFIYAKDGLVSFGSELKALRAGPAFDTEIDLEGLSGFLRYLYVPAPRTIYRHAVKLPPAHILTITDPRASLPAPVPYWSPADAARRGLADPYTGSDEEAIADLDHLLLDAVRLQMQSDVPLGALLSGGIDSSTIVSMMQEASSTPVETFSIGFDAGQYDESRHAAAVAKHLGTSHTELMLTGADALEVIPRLPDMFDEPFADASQIPTFLVCELARRKVTVALAGDGGDELFAGYHRYLDGERILNWMQRVPRPARKLAAAGIGAISPAMWERTIGGASRMLRQPMRRSGDKMYKIGKLLEADSEATMYRSLLSAWQHPESVVVNGSSAAGQVDAIMKRSEPADLMDRMMLADQATYLPDDLLAKTDRASMAVSLEVRVPLIDHRVVEFSWRLPHALKYRDGQNKWILRRVLYRRMPRALVDRPKMGFSPPVEHWLRGPLKGWAEDMIFGAKRNQNGELRLPIIRKRWDDFQAGRNQEANEMWAVLMYQAWRERWMA